MQIEMWPIERVKEYDRNPRNNDDAVGPVAESIRQFGFKVPVLVDKDGVIIAGHTRIKAARKLGLTEVPVTCRRPDAGAGQGLPHRRQQDGRRWPTGTTNCCRSSWPTSRAMDFDLELLGFSKDELAKLLDPGVKEGLTDPDEVPEPPDEAITQPGDLWILGDHRLLCGDSGKPEDVDRLLDGATIQLVNTDPPYNVKVEPRSNNAIAAGNSSFTQLPPPGVRPGPAPGEVEADHTEDAGQGPAAGERLRLGRGVRPDAARLVRQHGPRAGARPGVLHLGRLRQLRQLPAGAEGLRALLLPGDHLGQGASGADPQGLHGRPRVVLLRLAGRRGPPVLRPEQRAPTCGTSRRSTRSRWST